MRAGSTHRKETWQKDGKRSFNRGFEPHFGSALDWGEKRCEMYAVVGGREMNADLVRLQLVAVEWMAVDRALMMVRR